jgi:hypothetical protein
MSARTAPARCGSTEQDRQRCVQLGGGPADGRDVEAGTGRRVGDVSLVV